MENTTKPTPMKSPEVAVIGAGLAGLRCATLLHAQGLEVHVFERQEGVGGRVRTDLIDGFRLDRGFQVLQTAYPAAQRAFDYKTLDLHCFPSGAFVFFEGHFHPFFDPLRHPEQLWGTLKSGLFQAKDLIAFLRLARQLETVDLEAQPRANNNTALEALQQLGFSEKFLQRFLKPFLSGVFLERALDTRAEKLFFVLKAFREGFAALPAQGMQALAEQLAGQLPSDHLHLNCAAVYVEPNGSVHLHDGSVVRPRYTVLATDAAALRTLWPHHHFAMAWNCGTTVYFATEQNTGDLPEVLLIEGEAESGPVVTAAALHRIAPSYAPRGAALISANMPGLLLERETDAFAAARLQLRRWFGKQVDRWRSLACYPIRYALPAEPKGWSAPSPATSQSVWFCGDYLGPASIQGALWHAEQVAHKILDFHYP